jgi:hypothetical protein
MATSMTLACCARHTAVVVLCTEHKDGQQQRIDEWCYALADCGATAMTKAVPALKQFDATQMLPLHKRYTNKQRNALKWFCYGLLLGLS